MKTKWVVVGLGFAGYWGAGDTVNEALHNAQWLKTKNTVALYLCSEDAQVLDDGTVYGQFVRRIGVGRVIRRQNRPTLDLRLE